MHFIKQHANRLCIAAKNINGSRSFHKPMPTRMILDCRLIITLYNAFCYFSDALYSSPQFFIASTTGFKLCPSSESEYSTLGGTSCIHFSINKTVFSYHEAVQSVLLDTPPTVFLRSPNRFFPENKSRRISTFHLSPIKVNVVSTGHAGNFFTNFSSATSMSSMRNSFFLKLTY